MPDRVLQNHYCVAALQQRLSYNVTMSLPASQHSDQPIAPVWRVPGQPQARDRSCRAGLVVPAKTLTDDSLATRGPLRQNLRRWLAKARRAALDEESIEARFRDIVRSSSAAGVA